MVRVFQATLHAVYAFALLRRGRVAVSGAGAQIHPSGTRFPDSRPARSVAKGKAVTGVWLWNVSPNKIFAHVYVPSDLVRIQDVPF